MSDKPFLPYGRQWIDAEDLAAVAETLVSDWLTTGPKVAAFEVAVAGFCGAAHAVAAANGTAALHLACLALGLGPGDEVVVPPMTFAATANCALYVGARPVFCDVEPDTLLLDPARLEAAITPRTRAVIAVDYAGQPCRWDELREICSRRGLALVADACHALGAQYKGRRAGTLADLTVFSFHPVKHVATGEGGMILTEDPRLAERLRLFRNHGITSDHRQREENGTWFYAMEELGFNYRLTDIQCSLGLSQMKKLPMFLERRRALAGRYAEALAAVPGVSPLGLRQDVLHAWHLYVVRLDPALDRAAVFAALRADQIGVNVHYIPVHLHPYYRRTFGTGPGLCPVAEEAYERIISLPMFPAMQDTDVDRVAASLAAALAGGGGAR